MQNIKLTIEYDGTKYLGWQRLGDSEKTIQTKIEHLLSKLLAEKIEIIGSGRTDAGTHAKGQVANFKTNHTVDLKELQSTLNHQLPNDIIIKDIAAVAERFHARYNAKAKKYSYYVWNKSIPSVFTRNYSLYYPKDLDMDAMNEACEKLMGQHDFSGFSALKKTKKSTIRTMHRLSIKNENGLVHFTFVGDGFLYKMVRIIMGTLLEIGSGERNLQTIDEIFEKKIRSEAGETVPAQGLFLDKVYY